MSDTTSPGFENPFANAADRSAAGAGELAALAAAMDWSATPLGPRDGWPVSLRTVVDMLLAQPFPMVLRWGPQLIQIYNDGYRVIAGAKHPAALGRPMRETWPELWGTLEPICRRVLEGGAPVLATDRPLALERHGHPEVAYLTFSYAPVRGDDGRIAGVLGTVFETTDRVRAERQWRDGEQRLRLGLMAGNTGTWDWDIPADRVTWSEQIYAFHGLRPGEFGGRVADFGPLIHPDDRERVTQAIRDALERRAPYRVEYRAPQPDGSVRWIFTTGDVFFDSNGRPVRMMGAASDVTERKQVVEALRQSEARLLEAAQAARRTADRIARLQEVTERFAEALTPAQVAEIVVDHGIRAMGATAGSMALLAAGGATLEIVRSIGYPPEVIEPWLRFALDAPIPLAEVVRTGRPIFLETAAARHGKYPALLRLRPHHETRSSACIPLSVGGRTVGVMGLSFGHEGAFSDEDRRYLLALGRQCGQALERARLYEAEHAARQEAERASRAKDDFLAALSHELRTPLTPVLLTVSLMEAHAGLPPDLREDVQTIRRNVELESRLIGDLLDLTRIARGKTRLDVHRVDVHPLLRGAIDICQREGSARLSTDLRATRPVVDGDGARLQQVFWNLINNAQKFTGADGTIAVRTSDAPDGGRIRVEVADTGVGIDPEVMPRLFTAFEQGDTGTTRQFGGLGLGLAISKKLVELHGGTISASSAGRGRGATFTVELPVAGTEPAPAEPEAAPAPQATAERPTEGTAAAATAATAPLRILLVEDHEPTLRILTRLLAQLGHEVAATASLAAARAAARGGRFDLLLSDLGLPDGSGLDLMREFAPQYAGRAIALTGYGMEDDVRNSAAAGFAAHLTKPIDFERLEEAIRRVTAVNGHGSE